MDIVLSLQMLAIAPDCLECRSDVSCNSGVSCVSQYSCNSSVSSPKPMELET